MQELNRAELRNVKAGAIKWALVSLISGVITFFIGVVDGFVNPSKCRG